MINKPSNIIFLNLERNTKIPIKPNATAMKNQPFTTAPTPEDVEIPSRPPVVS